MYDKFSRGLPVPYVCRDCGAKQRVRPRETERAGRLRCASCGSLAMKREKEKKP